METVKFPSFEDSAHFIGFILSSILFNLMFFNKIGKDFGL